MVALIRLKCHLRRHKRVVASTSRQHYVDHSGTLQVNSTGIESSGCTLPVPHFGNCAMPSLQTYRPARTHDNTSSVFLKSWLPSGTVSNACQAVGGGKRLQHIDQLGNNGTCSLGLSCISCSFLTSRANTASGTAVESIHDALIEITKLPPFLRKYWPFRPTIRAYKHHLKFRYRPSNQHQISTADRNTGTSDAGRASKIAW